ncbi:MAG: thioredoxin domain-containing protein [Promethearchaeota archaeon]
MANENNVQEFSSKVSESEFNSIISKNSKVIVDVFAEWCSPCLQFRPIFEELSGEYENIKFISINSDVTNWINQKYSIESIPRFLFFNKGKLVYEHRGASLKSVFEFQIRTKLLKEKILNEMAEGVTEENFNKIIKEHPMTVIFLYEPDNDECELFKPPFVSMMEEFKEIYFILINAKKSPQIRELINSENYSQHGHQYPYFMLYKEGILKFEEHLHYPDLLYILIMEELLEISPIKRYGIISKNEFMKKINENSMSLIFIFKEHSPANSIMKTFLFNVAERFKEIHLGSLDINKNRWILKEYDIKEEDYSGFGEPGKKLPYFLYFKVGKLVYDSGPVKMEPFFEFIQDKLL